MPNPVTQSSRRSFLKILAGLPGICFFSSVAITAPADARSPSQQPSGAAPDAQGRIENDYVRLLPGEREALRSTPRVISIGDQEMRVSLDSEIHVLHVGQSFRGWRFVAVLPWLNGIPTAVLEKHVTHRGVLVYLTAQGEIARIPKFVGDLAQIRPRPVNPPPGIKFDRPREYVPGPDTLGNAILASPRDPGYENVAALGEEFIGWCLVANGETGPEGCLWLEAGGRSRESGDNPTSFWAPDQSGRLFDPGKLLPSEYLYDYVHGYSKRTMLGGFLPAADIGVWNPQYRVGYEVMAVLPPGSEAHPVARVRSQLPVSQTGSLIPAGDSGALQTTPEEGFSDRYWNGTAADFFSATIAVWNKWQSQFEEGMQVDIPDEWLLNAARGGIALARASCRGLEPTYQIGEGAYTKLPERSHALFPVAEYEFVWAQQLWNLTPQVEPYFQFYLDHYILPDGNFLYNTQDQVEAPLNGGVFLANSARAWDYERSIDDLHRRLPILRRMAEFVHDRYVYSTCHFPPSDPRHGLIWGSPEADMGDPTDDYPDSHPYYYQNTSWAWRGFREHARILAAAAAESSDTSMRLEAVQFAGWAQQIRSDMERSLSTALRSRNTAMTEAGITPFTPFDTHRAPSDLSSYENHRFMEDWWTSDWGDAELDLGHFRHREIAGMQILGMNTDGAYPRTSNFMSHGTLAGRIRQDDYRPFLLTLYALCCYTMDSGSRYSPEDAMLPGSYPGDGNAYGWSAVVNSALQPAMGLRWLLCYEEQNHDRLHLHKAAPKEWFSPGQLIRVVNCPTRFGHIGWSTEAASGNTRKWRLALQTEGPVAADFIIHIHPPDCRPLKGTSLGRLQRNSIVLPAGLIAGKTQIYIDIE